MKRFNRFVCAVYIIAACILFSSCKDQRFSNLDTFSLEDHYGGILLRRIEYSEEEYGHIQSVGEITSPEDAIEKAIALWEPVFAPLYTDDSTFSFEEITAECKVLYDPEEECLYIYGFVESDGTMSFGSPEALIKTDGTVLGIWHTM